MKERSKKTVRNVLVFSLSAVLAFSLFGCTPKEQSAHEHLYSDAWTSDANYHWHAPVCCADAEIERLAHSFIGGICAVCGYEKDTSPEEGQTPSGGEQEGGKTPEEEQIQGGGESQSPAKPNGEQSQGGEQKPEQGQTPSGGEQKPNEEQTPSGGEQKPEQGQTPGEGSGQQGGDQGGSEEEPQNPQVDPNPSLDERYGNSFPTDDGTFTGKPDANGYVKFRIRINRSNGLKICWQEPLKNGAYRLHYPKVRVTDEQKKEVYNNVVPVWQGCIYGSGQLCLLDLELPAGNYTVEPLDLPQGFVYQREYSLTPQQPVLDLRLSSKLLKSEEPIKKISEGMVFPDLTFHSINKGDTTLGALLRKHKIVILSFFYAGCLYCKQECPALVKIYQKYKDLFTFVLIDIVDSPEDTMNLVKSPQWFGELANDFYVVCDRESENPLYKKFSSSGVPANLFIDQGGFLFEDASGLTEAHFEEILYYNLMANVT